MLEAPPDGEMPKQEPTNIAHQYPLIGMNNILRKNVIIFVPYTGGQFVYKYD